MSVVCYPLPDEHVALKNTPILVPNHCYGLLGFLALRNNARRDIYSSYLSDYFKYGQQERLPEMVTYITKQFDIF